MIPNGRFHEAVALAVPGAHFVLDPENYGGLRMLDDTPKPTMQQINDAWDNRPEDLPQPSDHQLILWLMRHLNPQQRKQALEEASLL